MFGLLKKNQPEPATPDVRIAHNAAFVLNMALMLCRSTADYQEKLHSKFVRGYLIGFFDGAVQFAGLQIRGDQEFFALLISGHKQLLANDVPDPTAYTFASLRLQGDPEFDAAQTAGGKECFELLTGNTRTLILLGRYFHDLNGSE